MVHDNKDHEQIVRKEDQAQRSGSDSTLLPMLIGGLVLIILGMIAVMQFV